ncbi:hypothetical protein [Nocardia sp. NPDC050412]
MSRSVLGEPESGSLAPQVEQGTVAADFEPARGWALVDEPKEIGGTTT